MSISTMIFIGLIVLVVAVLPMWNYSKMWGRGYTPSVFVGLMLAAHGVLAAPDAAPAPAPNALTDPIMQLLGERGLLRPCLLYTSPSPRD